MQGCEGWTSFTILTEFKCRLPPFIRINGTAIVFDELLVSTAAGIKAITTMVVWILLGFIISLDDLFTSELLFLLGFFHF
jgi:hypothetical protein